MPISRHLLPSRARTRAEKEKAGGKNRAPAMTGQRRDICQGCKAILGPARLRVAAGQSPLNGEIPSASAPAAGLPGRCSCLAHICMLDRPTARTPS